MNVYTTKDVSDFDGDAEVARSTALFFEADRLDAFAYSILDTDTETDDIWKKFAEAKANADAKRAEAFRILTHSRLQKKPSVPVTVSVIQAVQKYCYAPGFVS